MKNITLLFFLGFLLKSTCFGQTTVTKEFLTVWIDQGWIIKAKNAHTNQVICKISWTTVGKNAAGEEVSRVKLEAPYYSLTVEAKEERRVITAPQDPKKEIIYTFEDIRIEEYQAIWTKEEMMQYEIEQKMKAKGK